MTKKTAVKFTLLAALLAAACFACLATSTVAFADEEEEASLQASIYGNAITTDVYLGSGTYLTTKATFDQINVKNDAIEKIKELRNEAYREGYVVNGKTIRIYCDDLGITRDEYTKITWSNALERIAVQRAVESGDSTLGSTRPNGESCYTATYQGIAADFEIQQWNNSTYTQNFGGEEFIKQIGYERQNYLDARAGNGNGKTYDNYLALINPEYTCVGVATTTAYDKKFVGVCELGKKLRGLSGSDSMGLEGTYDFEMAVGGSSGDDDISKLGDVGFCMDVTGCYRMNIGTTYKFTATLTYRGQKLNMDTGWYCTDESVISIEDDGTATAHKAGEVEVYVGGKDGYKVPHKITVPSNIEMYREYNPYDGQHLFTMDAYERDYLTSIGWNFENIGWVAPRWKKNPVYRLYNPYNGDHHYTMNTQEYDDCEKSGWRKEGVGFYSADASNGNEVYRLYNPYETVGYHHYTIDSDEYNWLQTLGWNANWVGEGVGWYALKQ